MKRYLPLVAFVLACLTTSAMAYSHLTVSVRGEVTRLKWNAAQVRWMATNRGVPGVTAGDFQTAIERAFATWEAVPSARIGFQFGGFTSAAPFDDDDLSVLGFAPRPDLERVLGATTFVLDAVTGTIVESDVFFNAAFDWSVSASGDPNRFDLQSVATHEIGHFLGLGHSALGETEVIDVGRRRVLASASVMFPIAFGRGNVADRQLQPDDVAAISLLYPDAAFSEATGEIAGTVRKNSRGVPGAHVIAFNPQANTMIAAFTNATGAFRISGLSPGFHVVRAEPLDDAEIDSFFSTSSTDADFRVTFHPQLVAAPAGGADVPVEVTVQPK
jgi:hypothetical protein